MQNQIELDIEIDRKDFKDKLEIKDGIDGKTPVKGVDYFDGKDGQSIMHYGKTAPKNPLKGDLWYQD